MEDIINSLKNCSKCGTDYPPKIEFEVSYNEHICLIECLVCGNHQKSAIEADTEKALIGAVSRWDKS